MALSRLHSKLANLGPCKTTLADDQIVKEIAIVDAQILQLDH